MADYFTTAVRTGGEGMGGKHLLNFLLNAVLSVSCDQSFEGFANACVAACCRCVCRIDSIR